MKRCTIAGARDGKKDLSPVEQMSVSLIFLGFMILEAHRVESRSCTILDNK